MQLSTAASMTAYATANTSVWIFSGYSMAVPTLLQGWHGLAKAILLTAMLLGAAIQAGVVRNVKLVSVLLVGGMLPIVAWVAFDVIGLYKKEYYLIVIPVALLTLLVSLLGSRRMSIDMRRSACQKDAVRLMAGIAFGGLVSSLLYEISDTSELLPIAHNEALLDDRIWRIVTGLGSSLFLQNDEAGTHRTMTRPEVVRVSRAVQLLAHSRLPV